MSKDKDITLDLQSIPLPEDEEPVKEPASSADNEEQQKMMALMGFTSFNSSKGKMVPGNKSVGAIHVVRKRRYRQYMNRKGGFNRPLDKVA